MSEDKPSRVNRETTVSVRVSQDAAERWRAAALHEGLSTSDYIRSRVDASEQTFISPPMKQKRVRTFHTADPELVRQVARCGNNLNQLAKRANEARAIDAVKMLTVLAALRRELFSLLPETAGHGGMEKQ